MTGIYQNEDYILIMIGNLEGDIIPKRAFVSPDAAIEFYDQTQSYYQIGNEL